MKRSNPVQGEDSASSAAYVPVRRNVTWALVGQGCQIASQAGILIMVAANGSGDLGRFTVAMALVNPIVTLTNCQLKLVQSTDTSGAYRLADFLGYRAISLIVAMAMLFAWALGRGDSGPLLQTILLVGLVKAAVSAGEVFLGVMQQRERMDLVARSWAFRSVASVGAFALGSSQGGLEGGLAAWAASSLLVLLAHDTRAVACLEGGGAWRQLRIRLDLGTLRSLLRLASPLAIAAFLSSLLVSLPVLALERFASIETTGLYGAVAYLAVMTRQALEAIGKATMPRMARAYVGGQLGAFRRILAGNAALVALMSVATIIVAAVGEEFYVGTIFSLSIPESGTAFMALMFAAAIGNFAQVAFLGLAATRAFRFSAVVIGASVVVLAVLCWIWVPEHSLNGVAGAAAAAGVFRLAVASAGVRSRLLQKSAAPIPTNVRTR